MAEVVDSIIVEFIARADGYVANFNKAAAAARDHTAALKELTAAERANDRAGGDTTGVRQRASTAEASAARAATAEAKAAAKERVAAEKAAAKAATDAAKVSAKERATAAREAAKAEVAAQKEAKQAAADRVNAEREYQTALARVREGEIVNARRERAELNRLRSQEAEGTAQARSSAFLAPLGSRGLSGSSARSSADVFREALRAEEQAAKASADTRVETEEQAQRRLSAVVERGLERRRVATRPGSGGVIGASVPRQASGQASIPAMLLAGRDEAQVVAAKEVNHLAVEYAELQSRAAVARGAERRIILDEIGDLRLIAQLQRAGLTDQGIALRLEERRAYLAKRSPAANNAGVRNAEQFARGTGLYAATGGGPAIAGIATAASVVTATAGIESSIKFAKELSDNAASVGVSTRQLQVYQLAAAQAGVSNEQLRSSFGQLNSYLGRAKEGDEQASKAFKALGIDIRTASSAGDVLPTLIARISSIADPAKRAALETRLFGEEGRRLDALLGGGTAKVDALASSLQRAGTILSDRDIATLRAADEELGKLRLQLEVDLAHIVAGNTGAILGLANAFATLAEKVLGAVTRLREYSSAQIVADHHGSEAYQGRARSELLNTHTGRQYLFDNAQGRLQDVLKDTRVVPGDERLYAVQPPGSAPKTVAQAKREERDRRSAPILAERREILARNRQDRQEQAPPAVQPGKVGNINSLFAPKPPKGKSAETLAAEAEARTKRYLDQLAGLQEAELRAQGQLTGSVDRRADIEVSLADRALQKQKDDAAITRRQNVDRGADPKLEQQRETQLNAAAQLARDTQVAGINQQRQADLIAASNQHLQTRLTIEAEQISAEAALAVTRKDRLALELRALNNQKQQERGQLQAQLAALKPGDPGRKDLETRLGSLDQIYSTRERGVRQEGASPIEVYRRQLHGATDDMRDGLEGVAVDALGRVEDSTARTIGQVVKLKGAFGDLFGGIIEDIARLELKKGILALLGNVDGGGGDSGGGLGGIIGGLFGHRASGGAVTGGAPFVVGERGPELFVPGESGRIVPNNSRVATGGTTLALTQHIHVDGRNSVTPDDFAAQIVQTANDHANRVAAAAGRAAVGAAPRRVQQQRVLGT